MNAPWYLRFRLYHPEWSIMLTLGALIIPLEFLFLQLLVLDSWFITQHPSWIKPSLYLHLFLGVIVIWKLRTLYVRLDWGHRIHVWVEQHLGTPGYCAQRNCSVIPHLQTLFSSISEIHMLLLQGHIADARLRICSAARYFPECLASWGILYHEALSEPAIVLPEKQIPILLQALDEYARMPESHQQLCLLPPQPNHRP